MPTLPYFHTRNGDGACPRLPFLIRYPIPVPRISVSVFWFFRLPFHGCLLPAFRYFANNIFRNAVFVAASSRYRYIPVDTPRPEASRPSHRTL